MNDFQFGLLGSIVYGGLTLGAGVATGVYSNSKWAKSVLVLTLVLNAASILLFTLSHSFYINAGLRFAIGFFQVFSCIFMPVWADAFANDSQKSVWLTILILSSPLGVVCGFSLTAVMVRYATWHYSFYLQGISILPCALVFFLCPGKYLDIDGTNKARIKCAHLVNQRLYKKVNLQNVPNFGGIDNSSIASSARKSATPSQYERQVSLLTKFDAALERMTNEVFKSNNIYSSTANIEVVHLRVLARLEKQVKKQTSSKG